MVLLVRLCAEKHEAPVFVGDGQADDARVEVLRLLEVPHEQPDVTQSYYPRHGGPPFRRRARWRGSPHYRRVADRRTMRARHLARCPGATCSQPARAAAARRSFSL